MNYLIDFKNTATKQEIDEYLSSNNCTFIKQFSSFENTVLVECSNIPTVTSLVENVTENQDLAVQLLGYPNAQGKDYPEAKFTTEDEDNWWKLAGFMRLDFNLTTQSLPRRGKSAIVYLVDSGIKSDHRDFENADIEHLFSFNQDFVDYNGHGTALASLLCGEVCSVSCPIVKSVKIFQAGVPTLQSDLLAAFDAIINDVKDNPGKLHIINLSWAVPKNEFIENKIKILLTCGALVVASAGNNGIPIENVTPASMKDVITVGAYDKNFYPCNFSNYTGNLSTNPNEVNYGMLDVWAPGELIRIARHIGDGYGNESGTSLSAAICSAALAYNSFMFELVDGTIPFYATDNQTDLRYSIVMKHDYLTLSDKYSGSTKSIVSFVQSEKDDETIKYGKMVGVHTMYYSDEKISTLLAPGTAYKSAYLDFNLPDGLYANDKYLYGSVTNDSNEPLVVSGTMNRIRFDDSIEQSLFNLVILPKTVTDKMTWFNDPVQNLVLHNMFIYEPQFCDGGCVSTGYCFDLGAQCGEKYVLCVCTNSICP